MSMARGPAADVFVYDCRLEGIKWTLHEVRVPALPHEPTLRVVVSNLDQVDGTNMCGLAELLCDLGQERNLCIPGSALYTDNASEKAEELKVCLEDRSELVWTATKEVGYTVLVRKLYFFQNPDGSAIPLTAIDAHSWPLVVEDMFPSPKVAVVLNRCTGVNAISSLVGYALPLWEEIEGGFEVDEPDFIAAPAHRLQLFLPEVFRFRPDAQQARAVSLLQHVDGIVAQTLQLSNYVETATDVYGAYFMISEERDETASEWGQRDPITYPPSRVALNVGMIPAAACLNAESPKCRARAVLVTRHGSKSFMDLMAQSTLGFDFYTKKRALVYYIAGVCVFRRAYRSFAAGPLLDTWLRGPPRHCAGASPPSPPSPWFPGSALACPFYVDVAVVDITESQITSKVLDRALGAFTKLCLRRPGGWDPRCPVLLDAELGGVRSCELLRTRWTLPEPRVFSVAAPEDAHTRARTTAANVGAVKFKLSCYPGVVYTASTDANSIAEACHDALGSEASKALPCVPWETLVDEFQLSTLSWLQEPPREEPIVLVPCAPERMRVVLPEPARRVPKRDPPRFHPSPLFRWLDGRLVRDEATRQGIGYVINPLVWCSLARLHYGAETDVLCITRMFFPMSIRCWQLETKRKLGDRPEVYRSFFKREESKEGWRNLLAAADNALADAESRDAIMSKWTRLFEGAEGENFVHMVDATVQRFVHACATNHKESTGALVQQQLENLQKILFCFQGFVPLAPALWNQDGINTVNTSGVVPHSNAYFLSLKEGVQSYSRFLDDRLRADHLSLFTALFEKPGDALGEIAKTLLQKWKLLVATPLKCQPRRVELDRAMLFLSAMHPVPNKLYPLEVHERGARVIDRSALAGNFASCGSHDSVRAGPDPEAFMHRFPTELHTRSSARMG